MEREEEEKAVQAYAALGIGFVCVLVGLPLWWKTTEVYRVPLPYNEIAYLSDLQLKYTLEVEVISFDSMFSDADQSAMSAMLRSLWSERQKDSTIQSEYSFIVRQAGSNETRTFQSAKDIQDLDIKLGALSHEFNRKYQVMLLPGENHIRLQAPYLGKYRVLFFTSQKDIHQLCNKIATTVREVLVRETFLLRTFEVTMGSKQLKPDKESMRLMRFNPGYDIIFNLFNPQPDIINVQWDIKVAIKAYVQPLLDKLEKYTHTQVKSQVLFFTGFNVKTHKNAESGEAYLYLQDLPHLLNPLESKLGFQFSNNPSLNFIVYIPTRDQSPLYIQNKKGKKTTTNAFLSPRWGGIYIYNVPSPGKNQSLPVPFYLDMKQIMEVFISQLRLLLNLQAPRKNVTVADVGNEAVTLWELDSWLRSKTIENIATSTATIQSLAKLLGEISNIVIRDDIGREVELAVSSIKESLGFLAMGRDEAAFFASKQAIASSEKAFFDPSLLELLYFPEDQKFAIYIPLFLPVSIPVIISSFQMIRWLIKRRRESKCKQE